MQRSPAPLSKLLRHRTPDEVLDEAVALTFPASDPISIDIAYARGEQAEALPSPEDVLDSAAELSFPASDPIAINVSYDRATRVQQVRAKAKEARARRPRSSSAARAGRTRSSSRT
jgi:hypothetical protein